MKNLDAIQIPESELGTDSAEEGYVFLDGPDGIAITLTPIAAIQMGEQLLTAGHIAARQEAT